MYANMKHTPTNTEAHANIKTNLKTYNKILRYSIEQAKTIYYQQKLTKYTNDIRNTWKVIKEVTNKTTTKTQLPEFFKAIIGTISSDTHQLQLLKLHHFKL